MSEHQSIRQKQTLAFQQMLKEDESRLKTGIISWTYDRFHFYATKVMTNLNHMSSCFLIASYWKKPRYYRLGFISAQNCSSFPLITSDYHAFKDFSIEDITVQSDKNQLTLKMDSNIAGNQIVFLFQSPYVWEPWLLLIQGLIRYKMDKDNFRIPFYKLSKCSLVLDVQDWHTYYVSRLAQRTSQKIRQVKQQKHKILQQAKQQGQIERDNKVIQALKHSQLMIRQIEEEQYRLEAAIKQKDQQITQSLRAEIDQITQEYIKVKDKNTQLEDEIKNLMANMRSSSNEQPTVEELKNLLALKQQQIQRLKILLDSNQPFQLPQEVFFIQNRRSSDSNLSAKSQTLNNKSLISNQSDMAIDLDQVRLHRLPIFEGQILTKSIKEIKFFQEQLSQFQGSQLKQTQLISHTRQSKQNYQQLLSQYHRLLHIVRASVGWVATIYRSTDESNILLTLYNYEGHNGSFKADYPVLCDSESEVAPQNVPIQLQDSHIIVRKQLLLHHLGINGSVRGPVSIKNYQIYKIRDYELHYVNFDDKV